VREKSGEEVEIEVRMPGGTLRIDGVINGAKISSSVPISITVKG
jgi:hypothetical protein